MREIKFKIYHKPTKTIQVVANISFVNKFVDTYGINEPMYNIPFNDIEIMQYTGLNDKKNKEIYEGDLICVCGGIFPVDDYNDFIYEVFYSENHSGIYGFSRDNIEVIGNIHENPELFDIINGKNLEKL